jgi:hypothetical protein
MEQITINEQLFSIYRTTGKTEIQYTDSITGLKVRAWLLRLEIEPRNKYIMTRWRIELRSNDVVVKSYNQDINTPANEFENFENSPVGHALKASIINGYFRFDLKNTFRVIDPETGEIIVEQPQIQV